MNYFEYIKQVISKDTAKKASQTVKDAASYATDMAEKGVDQLVKGKLYLDKLQAESDARDKKNGTSWNKRNFKALTQGVPMGALSNETLKWK